MYPDHIIGVIYARIEVQSLNPYCKGKALASQQKVSRGTDDYTFKVMISCLSLLTSLNDFIKWLTLIIVANRYYDSWKVPVTFIIDLKTRDSSDMWARCLSRPFLVHLKMILSNFVKLTRCACVCVCWAGATKTFILIPQELSLRCTSFSSSLAKTSLS